MCTIHANRSLEIGRFDIEMKGEWLFVVFAHETTVFLLFNIGSQESMDFSGDVLPKVRRRRQAVNVVAVNRCSPNLMRSNTGDLLEICKFDMLRIKYRSLDGRLPPEVSQ